MEKNHCHSNESARFAGKIESLDRPERKKAFPPEKLLEMVPIQKTDTILDLGAGTGYLTIPAAKMVDGLVYALDIDPRMVEVIASKAQAENIANIRLVTGSIEDIPLPADSMDVVLASLVLHEVKPLSETLRQIKRVLKEGGYFLCLEFEKKESSVDSQLSGPPMNIRIPSSVMEQEIIHAGFFITQKLFPNDFLYILIGKKQSKNEFTVERMISMLEERDRIAPIDKECDKFGIKKGDLVIDYGCGSGGYTKKVSELIGDEGKVYAVDIQELSIEAVKKKIVKYQLKNVKPILVKNIRQIEDNVADIILAIDMFHMVDDTHLFLQELHRLLKNNGYLFISMHHMTPDEARGKIASSKLWQIVDEVDNCLKCVPK